MSEDPVKFSYCESRFIISVIFIITGLLCAIYIVLPVFSKYIEARSWKETPCTIESLSGNVRFEQKRHRQIIEITVQYSYKVDGRKYFSFDYNFADDFAPDNYYSQGMETICYVNPDEPTEAVLNRDLPPVTILYLSGVLLLISSGITGIFLKKREKNVVVKYFNN